ncbi:MAG: ABC transporter ATP-binding protein [Candidatus Delongbacteria bacterium]
MSALRKVLRWFAPYWRKQRRGMGLVLLLTALGVAASTTYPLIFKFVLDELVQQGDPLSARQWVLALLGAGLLQQILQWLLPVSRAAQNLENAMEIRLGLFRRILRKTAAFFSRFRSGDLVTRLTDDIDVEDKLAWYSCSGVFRPIEAILRLVFSLIVMMSLDWRLTLFSVAPLPLVVWLMTRTEHLQEKHYGERQKRTSETVDVLESAFSGVRIVLSYAAEKAQDALFQTALERRMKSEKNVLTLRAVLEGLGSLLNQSGVVIVLFVGGGYLISGRISLGDFYAFVAYLGSLTGPLWTISWFFVSTNVVSSSVDRMSQVEALPEREPGRAAPDDAQCLHLSGLSFAWTPEGPPLLDNLSLVLARGETVAVVGPVGCGKTTLLELAAGIQEPGAGEVRLDGTPVQQLTSAVRSRRLGWVPQESLLFSGEVADNVSLGRAGLEQAQVEAALAVACVETEFPPGRRIEQGGVGLSGGQRGRVALARAVAARPDFLLLDDATSALDATTERRFWERLRDQLPETGVLVATHREATARVADRVLWLEQGRILHQGRHDELLSREPGYRELFAKE